MHQGKDAPIAPRAACTCRYLGERPCASGEGCTVQENCKHGSTSGVRDLVHQVAYPGVADNVSRLLPICLRRVNQPVNSSRVVFQKWRWPHSRWVGTRRSANSLFPHPPGSRAGLLPLSPLRTARESFPSSSSSLSNAPCGTRWCHIQRLAMDLPVAVGVQKDTVVRGILAPMHAPDNVMVVPSCESGDLLVANRTETVLVFPQVQQLPATFEGVCHLHAEAFFEVHFPLGVIRVCCAFNFDMPLNGHVTCTTEREFIGLPLVTRACPHEGPLSSLVRAKIFLRHPAARLLRVPPCGPGPQTLEDGCIHFVEGDSPHGGDNSPIHESLG